jgi:uncharacterized RDD family membrane protein YckC
VEKNLRRPRSREEAEIRKVEAETAEIRARALERLLRAICFAAVLGVLLADLLHGGDMIGRWLPPLP